VAPFVKAAGNPLELAGVNSIGLERRGFDEERRALIKRAYRVLFRSGLNVTQAVERLKADFDPRDEDLQTLVRFVEQSERGIQT
jgi:UDP-N-acetylglucosamine acyltransferase